MSKYETSIFSEYKSASAGPEEPVVAISSLLDEKFRWLLAFDLISKIRYWLKKMSYFLVTDIFLFFLLTQDNQNWMHHDKDFVENLQDIIYRHPKKHSNLGKACM